MPVFVFAVLIALGSQWVSKAVKKLVQFEEWARRVTGAIFVIVGVRYCLIYIFEVQLLRFRSRGQAAPIARVRNGMLSTPALNSISLPTSRT